MDSTSVVNSIKRVDSGIFCFKNDGTLCHNIFQGRSIYRAKEINDKTFIESF